ncbi:hypothetical protein ABTY53_24610 [Streptomyces noursei]|uniref:hypothetical protein n=1 Tax=Streptomyces noursei TaxID=1971 RepID=UPI00331D6C57
MNTWYDPGAHPVGGTDGTAAGGTATGQPLALGGGTEVGFLRAIDRPPVPPSDAPRPRPPAA